LRNGRRNEALDARIYSMAALAILNPAMDKIVGIWKRGWRSRGKRRRRSKRQM